MTRVTIPAPETLQAVFSQQSTSSTQIREISGDIINAPVGARLQIEISPEDADHVRTAKISLRLVNLEELKNVSSTLHGLQNDSVLLYNEQDAMWVITPLSILEIDGGFY